MQTRPLGPLTVSEIALGTWLTTAGGIERATAIDCIHAALGQGITLFDTANQYGAGEAERVLGHALRTSGIPRDQYFVVTKVFNQVGDEPGMGLSAAQIAHQLDRSLQRLGLDYLDGYLCHRYDPDVPLEETLTALDRAVRSGKVRAIGVSEWPVEQIHRAAQLTAAHSLTPLTISQPQYSLLWRKPETALFAATSALGLANMVYAPLAQGVLTGKYTPGQPPPPDSRAASSVMNGYMETKGRRFRSPDLLAAVANLRPIADSLGLSMSQLALAWVLRRNQVSSAIVGASRPSQIAPSVAASGITLPPAILSQIDSALTGFILS